MTEKILCSAVWFKDLEINKSILDPLDSVDFVTYLETRPLNCNTGLVFCGYRHYHCLHIMIAATGQKPNEAGEYIQGFLTSRNRFVDRKEGGSIHRANGYTTTLDDLFSEDLY